MNAQPPPPPPPAPVQYVPRQFPWGPTLIVVTLIVVSLWFTGALDHALVNVGLNKNPCIRNGFGATFCGQEAKDYCQNLKLTKAFSDSGLGDCDTILNEP